MAVSQQEFRQALGCFATGVTVLTVGQEGQTVHGMTVNAFTSVSLDPPLVLACLDHGSRTLPHIQREKRFGVNVLAEDQQAVADYFADPARNPEALAGLGVQYTRTERGAPLLDPCLAQLDCRVVAAHEAGDHTIVIAEAEEVRMRPGRPLVFSQGRFTRVAEGSS